MWYVLRHCWTSVTLETFVTVTVLCYLFTANSALATIDSAHTDTQLFYGPLSGTTQVGRYQKRHSPTHTWNVLWESVIILDFMRRGEDNRGKCTDNPAGRHPIWTIDAPTSVIPLILRLKCVVGVCRHSGVYFNIKVLYIHEILYFPVRLNRREWIPNESKLCSPLNS